MNGEEIERLQRLVNDRETRIRELETDLSERCEELESQKEELTAAVEQLIVKNKSLGEALVKLQKRTFEVDQILYRASHDLKTPISSIFGLLNILKAEGLNQSQRVPFEHLEAKANQMQSLLSSLSDLSTVSFYPLKAKPVMIRELFSRCAGSIGKEARAESVRIDIDSDQDQYLTDETLLTILVRELLRNALVYRTNPVGDVKLRVRSTEGNFILEVEDDGDGIPPEMEKKIFEMFYRGSDKSTGAGLGLYIAKTICHRLGGSIEFSPLSRGSSFRVRLPLDYITEDYISPPVP